MSDAFLAELLPAFRDIRVGVIGDLILDRYLWGEATRISPEAPVPVVRIMRESAVPGGAANVVRNVVGLGGRAAVFGAIGDDSHGDTLWQLLRDCGADTAGVVSVPRRPTTVKTRVLAGNQQVCRIDREETAAVPDVIRERLEDSVVEAFSSGGLDALILEDYAKGLLDGAMVQRLTDTARGRDILVSLDPHPSHPFATRGLSLMTPNRVEAFGLSGSYFRPGAMPLEQDVHLARVGRKLRQEWGVATLLITLGPEGMALFTGSNTPIHIPTRAREVFDVSGAGDTVMAACVLSLLAGATPEQAASLANHAAGVVVGKLGTVAVTAEELQARLSPAGDR